MVGRLLLLLLLGSYKVTVICGKRKRGGKIEKNGNDFLLSDIKSQIHDSLIDLPARLDSPFQKHHPNNREKKLFNYCRVFARVYWVKFSVFWLNDKRPANSPVHSLRGPREFDAGSYRWANEGIHFGRALKESKGVWASEGER